MTDLLETFVEEAEAVLAQDLGDDETARRIADLAQPLATDTSWLGDEHRASEPEQGFGITQLYKAPQPGLSVQTVCWAPGRGVAPHDHQTWGVVVGLEGDEINVDWKRTDDGSTPGHAELETAVETTVRNGDTCRFLPDDIHSVRNEGDIVSVSLHIYGQSLAETERSEFDPVNSIQRPCPQRVRR